MANEELIKVERKDIERTQKQIWNTSFFYSLVCIYAQDLVSHIYFSFGQQEPNAKSKNDDSFVGF